MVPSSAAGFLEVIEASRNELALALRHLGFSRGFQAGHGAAQPAGEYAPGSRTSSRAGSTVSW